MTKSPSPHDEPGGPHTAQTASLAYPANSPSPRPGSGSASSRRYNLQLRECIETKTITTTTRLTRQYPNVLSHDPKPLDSLDAKEYPLARRPPPPELANFRYTFSADGQRGNGLSEDYRALEQDDHQSVSHTPCTTHPARHVAWPSLGSSVQSTILTRLPPGLRPFNLPTID